MTPRWRKAAGLLALLVALPGLLLAGECGPGRVTLDQLRRMSCCELAELFGRAECGPMPHGCLRGHVLVMTNTRLPRVKARLSGAVWKGKCFADDGSFINQWVGFKALDSHAGPGTSWADGKPCIVMEYRPGTPLFANTRDELRQVGPGLYLGRLYDRCPCPKFRGFLALEVECKCERGRCR
jgi:hypothetical protein